MDALSGLRIVDLSRGLAGSHATKLLADYGADVVTVEPPSGDRARRYGPFPGDQPEIEASAPFLWLNTNKRSVVADRRQPEGQALIRRLVAYAEVLVEDDAPGEPDWHGLEPAALRAARPALVICSITPFGQTGPYARYQATDLVLQAMGSAMHATGHPEREPLALGSRYAEWHAGLAAALAIMLAVYRAEATGAGDQIDLSIYETLTAGKDRRQLALVSHAYTGLITRRQQATYGICCGIRPCADGYINLFGNGPRLPALLRLIGRADLLAHPAIGLPEDQMPAALIEEIESAYLEWTLRHEMRRALALAQAQHILGGAIYSVADLLGDAVLGGRGAWERIDHPATGPLDYPGRPFVMSDTPRPPARRAPLLGEHTATVPAEWEQQTATATAASGSSPRLERPGSAVIAGRSGHRLGLPATDPKLPLQGVRVLDLTVVWAGPYASQQLAEWGAEVIRMEPVNAIQPQTRHAERARFLTKEFVARSVAQGTLGSAYANGDPGPDPWNRNPMFNSSSSNKLSFTGNATTAAGRATFEQMVAIADVVIENNVPSTAAKMGIDYQRLRAINPGIIVVRMPGFGLDGAYADYRCWGTHLEGMAGLTLLRSYPEMTLEAAGDTYACDSVAGLMAALATVMALRHRARTGRGQQIEVPQLEAFAQLLGVEILDYGMNGRVAGPMGNDHPRRAPHGAYRCRPADDDAWIAIDATTDQQWAALCQVLGAAGLASDRRFATEASRWQHRRELDALLTRHTERWERYALFHALQAAGVPAGPVQNEGDCFRCPQLAARGFFQEQTRPDIGTHRYPGMLFRWVDTPNHHRRPPVRLGQDNEYVYQLLLGVSPARRHELTVAGEIGTSYPAALLGIPTPADHDSPPSPGVNAAPR